MPLPYWSKECAGVGDFYAMTRLHRYIRRPLAPIGIFFVTVVSLATAAPAWSDPIPFASLSSSCPNTPDSGEDSFTFSPVGGNHPETQIRVQASAPITFIAGSSLFPDLDGPDVAWASGGDILAGETPNGRLLCDTPTTYSLAFSDVPSAPVTFSGATTSSGDFGAGVSELLFHATATGPYAVYLTLQSGAVRLSGGPQPETFASSGVYQLGEVSPPPDRNPVQLEGLAGPQAVWSASIVPLPIVLSGVRFVPRRILPGAIARLRFTTNGTTQIAGQIIRLKNRAVVRSLSVGHPVRGGNHVLYWNGKRASGKPVPPGIYAVRLTSHDYNGHISRASTRLRVLRPILRPREAKRVSRRFWTRKVDNTYTYSSNKHLTCSERVSLSVRKCRASFVFLDDFYKGVTRVREFTTARGKRRYLIRYRLTRIGQYCPNRPPRACVDTWRGRTRLR